MRDLRTIGAFNVILHDVAGGFEIAQIEQVPQRGIIVIFGLRAVVGKAHQIAQINAGAGGVSITITIGDSDSSGQFDQFLSQILDISVVVLSILALVVNGLVLRQGDLAISVYTQLEDGVARGDSFFGSSGAADNDTANLKQVDAFTVACEAAGVTITHVCGQPQSVTPVNTHT